MRLLTFLLFSALLTISVQPDAGAAGLSILKKTLPKAKTRPPRSNVPQPRNEKPSDFYTGGEKAIQRGGRLIVPGIIIGGHANRYLEREQNRREQERKKSIRKFYKLPDLKDGDLKIRTLPDSYDDYYNIRPKPRKFSPGALKLYTPEGGTLTLNVRDYLKKNRDFKAYE